jgi:hypothetical protein
MDSRRTLQTRGQEDARNNKVVKRTQRAAPSRPTRKQETKPVWPTERHSGEGSASALETLQKIEKRRGIARPVDPRPDEFDS